MSIFDDRDRERFRTAGRYTAAFLMAAIPSAVLPLFGLVYDTETNAESSVGVVWGSIAGLILAVALTPSFRKMMDEEERRAINR